MYNYNTHTNTHTHTYTHIHTHTHTHTNTQSNYIVTCLQSDWTCQKCGTATGERIRKTKPTAPGPQSVLATIHVKIIMRYILYLKTERVFSLQAMRKKLKYTSCSDSLVPVLQSELPRVRSRSLMHSGSSLDESKSSVCSSG